jgi:nucleotide-binding universal stress UspA family protein/hemerythrin-like domain-containing protein
MYKRLLVPLDGTPLAERCVEQALALARVHGAEVYFLHVQPDFAGTDEGALLVALSPALFADGRHGRAHALLARAEAAACAAGVACHATIKVNGKPHRAILEAATELACDLIFMASHGRRGILGSRLGGITRKVLDAATVPVLVAAVEVNRSMDAQSRALHIIRSEHRSLAAVMHAMQVHWQQVERGGAPRFDLVRAMLYYIEHFPERRHHPKEDEHLFARLRQRCSECDALLNRLQSHHREGTKVFQELRVRLAGWEAGATDERARFGRALDRFVRDQWQHMACEEQFVLPAASQWLTPEDWEAIASAFGANADPRFGADTDEDFEQLADRLLNLAASASAPQEQGA